MGTTKTSAFADLLAKAVTEPGIVSDAYRQFHNYSIGNQLLAWSQCMSRDLQPGPLATYQRWRELGRQVRKGEKAIVLCRPITVRCKTTDENETDETSTKVWFVFKPYWFVLSQTDGQDIPPAPVPTWDRARALGALDVTEIEFDLTNGNVMGYARATLDCRVATQPTTAQDALSRTRACAARPHQRGRAVRRRARLRAICASVKPKPSRCSAVRRSTYPASNAAVATSNRGGERATRSPNAQRNASSRSPIRSWKAGTAANAQSGE